MRDAAHEKTVRRFFLRDDRQRRLVKIGDQRGHLFLAGVVFIARFYDGNRKTFTVRVGVRQRAFQPLAAKHDDKAMLLARLDEDVGVADFFDLGGEHRAQFLARFGRDAAGAPVGNNAFCIYCGEIGAGADVAMLEFHAQAERLDDAAAHLEFQRVIAKQAEVAGPAAGRDAGRSGNHAALRRVLGNLVEIRRRGGLERREIILFLRGDVAQAVEDDEREFAVGFQCQFGIKRV